jgi:hypothetical protein
MTTSSTTAGRGTPSAARGGSRPRGAMAGMTEARPGIITSEFWLTLIAAAAAIAFGYISDGLGVGNGWGLGAGIVAAYVVSRGLAKAGSREGPFVAYLDDDADGSSRR